MFNSYLSYNYSHGITKNYKKQIEILKKKLYNCDSVLIGAGAGLSTSAGFLYSGERFQKYFFDFAKKFGIKDMYSGGFYPFPDEETFWAWWSRAIYYNRYADTYSEVYKNLFELVKDKNYFVLTTNVDHWFQKSRFDKKKLFYTQGDYGLFQSVNPQIEQTFDNEKIVYKMMESQGFVKDENGVFQPPSDEKLKMSIPTKLIPKCEIDGSDMTINLRCDDSFVQDEGWYLANNRYDDFLKRNKNSNILYLELGVGMNTPVIIKYPFWKYTRENKNSFYICMNMHDSICPYEIETRSLCITEDIGRILSNLLERN